MGCDPLLNYKMDKCIKCGLCTYMCPSKREVVK
jgi:Na+-translocating ferredoxin:NAD+ oxidoreductase RnfC subunit